MATNSQAVVHTYCPAKMQPSPLATSMMDRGLLKWWKDEYAHTRFRGYRDSGARYLQKVMEKLQGQELRGILQCSYDEEETPNVRTKRKIECVADLYQLTTTEIQAYARSAGLRCGHKSIRALNRFMNRNGLPDISAYRPYQQGK